MDIPHEKKTRITSHMNKEHQAELKLYLRAFNGLSSAAAADAEMVNMTLQAMTIKSASGVHTVRIFPPMSSSIEARERFVAMAAEARQKLGLDDIQITTFAPPRGGGLVSIVGFSCYCVSAAALLLGLLRPGTLAWILLDKFFPYGAGGFAWTVRTILGPVLLIHATEAWWMARSRLAKHGVETFSMLWFQWVLETFGEGFPSFQRFDALVEEEKRKKKAGHMH